MKLEARSNRDPVSFDRIFWPGGGGVLPTLLLAEWSFGL